MTVAERALQLQERGRDIERRIFRMKILKKFQNTNVSTFIEHLLGCKERYEQ